MQPVNLCHRHTGRRVVSRVACHQHGLHSRIRVPVARITSHLTQTMLGAGGGHSSWPWPGVLTTPVGAQKLQLTPKFQPAASPSSISQDPSDTKTLTGPGMRMLCQRSWLRARNAPQQPPILLDVVFEGHPRVRRISNASLSERAWKRQRKCQDELRLRKTFTETGARTPLASSAFPQAR